MLPYSQKFKIAAVGLQNEFEGQAHTDNQIPGALLVQHRYKSILVQGLCLYIVNDSFLGSSDPEKLQVVQVSFAYILLKVLLFRGHFE